MGGGHQKVIFSQERRGFNHAIPVCKKAHWLCTYGIAGGLNTNYLVRQSDHKPEVIN